MGFLREQMGEEELRHLLEMLSVEAGACTQGPLRATVQTASHCAAQPAHCGYFLCHCAAASQRLPLLHVAARCRHAPPLLGPSRATHTLPCCLACRQGRRH